MSWIFDTSVDLLKTLTMSVLRVESGSLESLLETRGVPSRRLGPEKERDLFRKEKSTGRRVS